MSEHDAADHVEDEVSGAMRTAVAAGAYGGVQMARARQERARRAQEEGAAAARLDAQRVEAMWQESRSELMPVMDDAWWERATPEEIGQAYRTVTAWEGRDEAAPFAARMRDEVRSRYGVDLEQVRPDDTTRELNLRDGDGQYSEAAKDRAEAHRLMMQANREEAAEQEAGNSGDSSEAEQHKDTGHAAAEHGKDLYDSAERREDFAQDLSHRGVPAETVEARISADVGQGRPSSEAARGSTKGAPTARRTRHPQQRERQRGRQR